ncbi:MAG: type I glyceraldehyde-3-phosphate dehydrogenase [Patescibacteria group bacterium]|nr:type I glyceraldehyde-3-phosphate dehydrogenase [Patescibacteria group bacterium]
MAVRVAINGFGRIGRCLLRAAAYDPGVDIVAINDLGDIENLAYLLRHDSVYGAFPGQVSAMQGGLMVGAKRIEFLQEKEPATLPWKRLAIDVVVESTGVFDSFEKASVHIAAGAKRVVISAPVKDDMLNAATVLMGVNEEKLATCSITSNASCTTNAASPVVAVLEEALDIEKALLDTVHALTATQSTVDSAVRGSDKRRGRAGSHNIVPSSTGAATALTKAVQGIPFFDGMAVRVPVIAGSYVDLTFVTKRDTNVEEVNKILSDAAMTPRWQGILAVSDEPLVSSDIIGRPEGSIVDLPMTRVVGGNLVKVLAWYDNEMGYTHTLLRHVKAAGTMIK